MPRLLRQHPDRTLLLRARADAPTTTMQRIKALVTGGTRIPAGSLVLGAPAKIVRSLSAEERAGLKHWADKYVVNGAYCLKHRINVGRPLAT